MKETREFLIPDYYLEFSCKTGECRSACCVGWPITVSMRDYFFLLGVDCDEDLRKRIDCGVRIKNRPTEEEYARFEPRYDGNCPLRCEDGKCVLHAKLGEDVLPDVCCLYPRGVRVENGENECSCANSCEKTLELLFKNEPITFIKKKLTLRIPPVNERKVFFETLGLAQKIRLYLISVIQDRSFPLPIRIVRLGEVMTKTEELAKAGNKEGLESVLNVPPHLLKVPIKTEEKPFSERLEYGLEIAERMTEFFDERSLSLKKYGEEALAYFRDGNAPLKKYEIAEAKFKKAYPEHEAFYENVLVNHVFFSQFPFQDREESAYNEFIAVCSVYALLRFLGLGVAAYADSYEKSTLIDVFAATFRMIEHTEYDRYASKLLRSLNCDEKQKLYDLLSL